MAKINTSLLAVTGALLLLSAAGQAAAVTPAAPFNPRKPADLVAALKAKGVTGDLTIEDGGLPLFSAEEDGLKYVIQFRDCSKTNEQCNVAVYMGFWTDKPPPVEQINLWNDLTFNCTVFESVDGESVLKMGYRAQATDTRAAVDDRHAAWWNCVGQFGQFLQNPKVLEEGLKK